MIFTYPHSLLGSLPWMPSLPMAAIQLVCKSSLQPSFLSLSSWYTSLSTMPAPYPPISALPSPANFTCSMTFHQSHCSALLYQCGLVSTWQDVLLWCNCSQASLLLIPARKILSHFIDETIFLLSKILISHSFEWLFNPNRNSFLIQLLSAPEQTCLDLALSAWRNDSSLQKGI